MPLPYTGGGTTLEVPTGATGDELVIGVGVISVGELV